MPGKFCTGTWKLHIDGGFELWSLPSMQPLMKAATTSLEQSPAANAGLIGLVRLR